MEKISLHSIKKIAKLANKMDKKDSLIAHLLDRALKMMVYSLDKSVSDEFAERYFPNYLQMRNMTEETLTKDYKVALKDALQMFVDERGLQKEDINDLMYDLSYDHGLLSLADKEMWPAPKAPFEGIEDPKDKELINVHYVNFRGDKNIIPVLRESIYRRKSGRTGNPKAHISVTASPSGRTISLAINRIQNWQEVSRWIK